MTQSQLKELFDYHQDGYFIIKKKRKHTPEVGEKCRETHNRGYKTMCVYRKMDYVHRAIFIWHYGYAPKWLDHINGDKTDNRIENLRPATYSQNAANRRYNHRNKGVTFNGYRFLSRIHKDGIVYRLGTFKTKEEAALAYDKKAKELFGEYACTNF